MTWEWTLARPMLLLHALSGFAALAISVHVLYFAWRGGGDDNAGHRARARARRYAAIAWPLYVAAMVTGALVYPAYKVGVREAWLDANRPALTGLFEIKEHWAALGLLVAWGVRRYLCRSTGEQISDPDATFWRGQTVLTLIVVICALANVVIGAWVVMVKSV